MADSPIEKLKAEVGVLARACGKDVEELERRYHLTVDKDRKAEIHEEARARVRKFLEDYNRALTKVVVQGIVGAAVDQLKAGNFEVVTPEELLRRMGVDPEGPPSRGGSCLN